MKTFDYRTAWHELAKPMFDALPQGIRDLYSRIQVECADLHQGQDLNMPWPEHGAVKVEYLPPFELKLIFDEIEDNLLAEAARVIYDYGHWYPGNNTDKVGGHWKFSNYADQSLASRIAPELRPHGKHTGNGISFQILEGFLRAQFSSNWGWTWQEICPATLENWEKIMKVARPNVIGHRGHRASWDKFQDKFEKTYCPALRAECPTPGRLAEFLNMERFMVEESEIKSRQAI